MTLFTVNLYSRHEDMNTQTFIKSYNIEVGSKKDAYLAGKVMAESDVGGYIIYGGRFKDENIIEIYTA
jgi:hypothetical protein